ncbi:MAG: ArsR/SmtB family transcription factor [Candidatus Pacearchaeota archaeon]
MNGSSISIDIDDPRTGLVAEALANKTCVKILALLAEKDLTAGDIAKKLAIPLNTTGYNLEKLIATGLVEKTKDFFWSPKGKKTPTYRVANRRIVISPKRLIRGVVPAVLISGVMAVVLRYFTLPATSNNLDFAEKIAASSSGISAVAPASVDMAIRAPEIASTVVSNAPNLSGVWGWFFIGALFSLIMLFLWDFVISNTRRLK